MLPYILSFEALAGSLELERRARGRLLVCIDGCGASGKTSIAAGLAGASGEIQVVHIDDFYRPSWARYVGPTSGRPIGADFDLARLRAEVLVPVRSGLAGAYRVYDWSTDRLSSHAVSVSKSIVIVEGVYSSSLELSELFDFSIWVECPRGVRLARGLARDGEGARSRWDDDWMPEEDRYIEVERPRDRVALVCDGGRSDCKGGVVVLQERRR